MIIPFFIYISLLFSEWSYNQQSLPYNLNAPDKTYLLPKELNEISGIADIGSGQVACIADEKGIIYIYDLKSEKITNKIKFGGAGDYEDIVYHADTYYILESNGDITQFSDNYNKKHSSPLTKFNNTEGLCYDPPNNRLLIVCKEPPLYIYSFSLKDFTTDKKPIAEIVTEKFAPTALAFLNKDELLVLSGNGKLGIYSMEKRTSDIIPLNKKLFPQPEGIVIRSNGDLLISNEATKKGEATILLFHKK